MNIDYNLQQHGIGIGKKKIPIGNSKPDYNDIASISPTNLSTVIDKAKLNSTLQQVLMYDNNGSNNLLKVLDSNLQVQRTMTFGLGVAFQTIGLGNDGAVYWNDNLPNLTKWNSSGTLVLNAVAMERLRDFAHGIQFSDDGLRYYGCPMSLTWKEFNTATGAVNRSVNITQGTYCNGAYYDKVAGKLYGLTDANKVEEVDVATWTIPRSATAVLSTAINIVASQNYLWLIGTGNIQIINKSTLAIIKTVATNTIINGNKTVTDYANDILYYTGSGQSLNAMNSSGDVMYSLATGGETAPLGMFTNKDLLVSVNLGGYFVKRRKYYTRVLR